MHTIPLYIKTDNSLQDSLITIPSLIQYAKELGLKELGIADFNMYGVMDFYKACQKEGIKPYIGLEMTLGEKKFLVYAQNYTGYQSLLKLTTISSERTIELEDIREYSKDLVCLLPYESSSLLSSIQGIYQYLFRTYKTKEEKKEIEGPSFYLKETIYLKKEESRFVKYLDAMREGVSVDLVSSTRLDNYLKLDEELVGLESSSIDDFRELCQLEIPMHQNLMPIYQNEEGLDSYSYLKKKCIEGLRKRFGKSVSSRYQERLKKELDVIQKMGFCDYFLIVYDYIKYAKEQDIIVGPGRGSAVGSLVAYLLGITDIDPLKYDLFFERFLNVERISMPDIDIDFEHNRREDVINYCKEKYGAKKVAPIISFGTMGAKQAIRDVGRAMNLDLTIIDGLCKLIDSRLTLLENRKNAKIQTYLERHDSLKEVYEIAYIFEGLKRHTSIHAAGVVMSRVDLDTVIPLDQSHQNFYTSGYDMTYLEEIGLLKMDFLAIKYLTIIHNIIKEINTTCHLSLTFDSIPFEDPKALKLFESANTLGIFQFESEGMIQFLRQLRAKSFEDVCAAIALFRPGPMQNISSFIRRREGKEKIDYLDESLVPILKSTYGIMIYQEQIMQIAQTMADYSLGEADILRKAMSKKKRELLLKEEEKFTSRALKKGYTSETVKKVYALMLKFAEYGFNKSHSVGYSMVSCRMAYLKAHFPKIFMANLLSIDMNDSSKAKKYFYECRKNHIDILKPDINKSGEAYLMEEKGIRYPLSNIKNVGMAATKIILEERQKSPFQDLYDFIKRCYGKGVNRKVVESLNDAGVFLSFGWNRKTVAMNLDAILNYGDLMKDLSEEFALKPDITEFPEYSAKEIMERELELFGLYLSEHPITELKSHYPKVISLSDLPRYFDQTVKTIIYVDKVKEIETKKKEKMAFLVGSDELSSMDFTLFPTIYQNHMDITKGDILLVTGKVEKRFDKYQLIVERLDKLKEG